MRQDYSQSCNRGQIQTPFIHKLYLAKLLMKQAGMSGEAMHGTNRKDKKKANTHGQMILQNTTTCNNDM